MKVLRITTSLDYGGIEKVFELHATYFDKKEYELIFVAIGGGGYTSDLAIRLGYRVILLQQPYHIPSVKALWALVILFLKEKPDVVHTCGGEANFHGIIAAFLTRVRVRVAEEIGIPSHSGRAKFIFRTVYKLCNRVIAISKAVKEYLVLNEAPSSKVSLIYNPVSIPATVKTPNLITDKVIICCLCRLEPIKNCDSLINLLSELIVERPNLQFELWFIGDGTQRLFLEELATSKGVKERVHFWGFQPSPTSILEQGHLFILPSWREGFGLACIEAIQSGLVVVVSREGGMKEFITDGYNGFIIAPSDSIEIKEKTLAAIDQPEFEKNLFLKRANQIVAQLFSPHKYLKSLFRIYSETTL